MSNTVRLNLVMPKRTLERIEALIDKTEATSKADVVRDALRFYEAMVNDVIDGKAILSRDKNGNLEAYKIDVVVVTKPTSAANVAEAV